MLKRNQKGQLVITTEQDAAFTRLLGNIPFKRLQLELTLEEYTTKRQWFLTSFVEAVLEPEEQLTNVITDIAYLTEHWSVDEAAEILYTPDSFVVEATKEELLRDAIEDVPLFFVGTNHPLYKSNRTTTPTEVRIAYQYGFTRAVDVLGHLKDEQVRGKTYAELEDAWYAAAGGTIMRKLGQNTK